MKILIAEDDAVSRLRLETELRKWGYEVIATSDGQAAWSALTSGSPPLLGILDWMMPGIDGVELCRRARATPGLESLYLILLTARGERGDVLTGLGAGADDFVVKPFDREELRARVKVGERVATLQVKLAERVTELQAALASVEQLHGLLPICAYCKKIRGDGDYWQQVETYITAHSAARFSHGICPACHETHIVPQLKQLRDQATARSSDGGK